MSLFGRSKSKREKVEYIAAAANLPRPPQHQTVINHAPSEAGKIFAIWIARFLTAVVIWFFLLYLVGEMGYKDPVRVVGLALFGLIGLGVLTAALYFGGTRLLLIVRDTVIQVAEINANARIESSKSQALTAGAPALPNERLTGEEKKLFENLAIVMDIAYRDLVEKRAPYKGGNIPRPWSKASVLSLNPPRHGRMSYMKADTVRKWLVAHNVVLGEPQKDQVNTEMYPGWADFRALLEDEFNMPVVVGQGQSPTLTGRYDHINI